MTTCRVLYLSDSPGRTQICWEFSPTGHTHSWSTFKKIRVGINSDVQQGKGCPESQSWCSTYMYRYVYVCMYIYIYIYQCGRVVLRASVTVCQKIRLDAQPVKGCPPDKCRSVCLLSVTGRSAYALRSYQSLFSHWIWVITVYSLIGFPPFLIIDMAS